jgi:hypothetical protein
MQAMAVPFFARNANERFCLKALSFLLLAAILAAAGASAQTPGPAPRLDAWKVIGPGGGGTTASPTISPNDPKLVVLRCDMSGAYITHDGGNSWRMFNLRTGLASFAFDPNNPKRIYAGGAALWRSDDTGATWSMVFPDPAKKTVEHQNGDHGDYSLTTRKTRAYTSPSGIKARTQPCCLFRKMAEPIFNARSIFPATA